MALVLVETDLIDEDPRNPRGEDVGDVTALKQAMLERGQEDPLHLIPRPDGRYFLHEGHRRLKVLREIGWQAKAIERHFATELDRLLSQGQMHAHRKDWSPMAWANFCYRLFSEQNLSREDIARKLGRSQGFVRDHLSFVHLLDWEKGALDRGELTKGEALRRLADRRVMRAGRPPTQKKTAVPPTQRGAVKTTPHLSRQHQLAGRVAERCASGGSEHAAQPQIGGVGCGRCWEEAIRADALTSMRAPLQAVAA